MTGCAGEKVLRLATTTSTYDSGLLDAIIPGFESQYGARVDVIAVGTGQAIALGERGDADVLMVHDRAKEEAFVREGHGIARYPVMYNDFILVGPSLDPAGVVDMLKASEALLRIAVLETTFASRGDQSGTHSREMFLWEQAGLNPDPGNGWYLSIGQGMGETLQFADERGAYTLTDRGTFLAQSDTFEDLVVLVGGNSIDENEDPLLLNPYGVIPVNPEMHDSVDGKLAMNFAEWLQSEEVQKLIASYGLDLYGQPLFYPSLIGTD